jgi:hypothetical protein
LSLILIASPVADTFDPESGLYVTIVATGDIVSRGLAGWSAFGFLARENASATVPWSLSVLFNQEATEGLRAFRCVAVALGSLHD